MIPSLIGFIYDNFKAFLWLLLFLFGISIYFLIDLKVDNSVKIWFDEEDSSYQNFLAFQDSYGNDDIITVMLSYDEGVFGHKPITEMLELEYRISSLEYVDEIYCYGSAEIFNKDSTGISLGMIISKDQQDSIQKVLLLKRLESFPEVRQTFIADDELSHIIIIRLRNFEEIENERDNIVRDLKSIINEINGDYHIAGMAVLNEALNTTVARESGIFSLLNYLALIILLFFIIKKRRYIYLVLPAIALPTIFTFGLFAATGQSINLISTTLPTILMVYALADVVHIINNYIRYAQEKSEFSKREQVIHALTYSYKPCLYASSTTMLAYISFYASSLEVLRITGLYAFIGLAIAFITVYLVSIIGFALLQPPAMENEWQLINRVEAMVNKSSQWLIRISSQRKTVILIVFGAILVLGILQLSNVEINTYPGEYLDESSEARQDSKLIEDKMGAYLPFEFLVKSTDQSSLLSTDKLIFLQKFQDQIGHETSIYNPSSLVEVIKYLNQQIPVNGNYEIPQSNPLISQLVLNYEMQEKNKLSYLTNKNYSEIKVTGKVKIMSVNDYAQIARQAKMIFNDLGGPSMNLELEHQGYIPVYIKLTNNVTSSLLYSFLGAFIMISIAMAIFIRQAMITLFCIVTNLVPVAFIILLLVTISIPIDMGTVMMAAIMFGIAVDDTMHLVHAYNYNRQKGVTPSDSINQAIRSTNKALLASSLALAVGFLILGMSSVSSLRNFGNLCAAAVVITYLADVLLLPVLVKTLSKA